MSSRSGIPNVWRKKSYYGFETERVWPRTASERTG